MLFSFIHICIYSSFRQPVFIFMPVLKMFVQTIQIVQSYCTLCICLGDSPFFCQLETCGVTFKTSSDLTRHMKQHKQANQSPYSSFHGECSIKYNYDPLKSMILDALQSGMYVLRVRCEKSKQSILVDLKCRQLSVAFFPLILPISITGD